MCRPQNRAISFSKPVLRALLLFVILLASQISLAANKDWPTYGGDYQRSSAATEGIALPLSEVWTHKATDAPSPAWPAPATDNLSAGFFGLSPTLTYDRAFHSVSADGQVFFASSTDDSINCLDAETGQTKWVFITQAPVRLAPTVADGRVFAGSDDGYLYCLDAKTGDLVWKHRGGPSDSRLPGNGRMISLWPVRCGVALEEGLVYFTAGLFPMRGVYLCAVDAKTGKTVWKKKIDIAPQGFMLSSPSRLFIPTGRTPFRAYDRKTGEPLAKYGKSSSWGKDLVGGCHAILIDDTLATGPSGDGQIHLFDTTTKERLISTAGIRMIARGNMAYILQTDKLFAMDRTNYVRLARKISSLKSQRSKLDTNLKDLNKKLAKDPENGEMKKGVLSLQQDITSIKAKNTEIIKEQRACFLWEVPCDTPHSMILLGETLFTGGENKVIARNAKNGKTEWEGTFPGKAYGLARSGDQLLVSTDKGSIHSFGPPTMQKTTAPKAALPVSPYPKDTLAKQYATYAENALRLAGVKKGYCLVLNADDARLAWEISLRSEMKVIAVMSDEKSVDKANHLLKQTGQANKRLSIHCVDQAALPYPDYCANLVVVDTIASSHMMFPAKEALRVLRPVGGVITVAAKTNPSLLAALKSAADLNWKTDKMGTINLWSAKRPALPGAKDWTHMYADAGNSACSDDELVKGEMVMQWFGRPGPRRMVDRHKRAPSPLVCAGRLFITGQDYIAGVDAYNGTVLWENDVPGSMRVCAPKNTSNMVATPDSLYVAARTECIRFDPQTGRELARFNIPGSPEKMEWGYIGQEENTLFGSATAPRAILRAQTRENNNIAWGTNQPMLCANHLFAINRISGKKLWTYEPQKGMITNTSIAIDKNKIVFVESTNPETFEAADGRVPPNVMLGKGSELVALNTKNGKELWRTPTDLKSLWHVFHLSMADNAIVITGSNHKSIDGRDRVRYDQFTFDARTGKKLWQMTQSPTPDLLSNGHGVQVQHPAIRNGIVYGPGFASNLQTGDEYDGWKWVKDRKCGTVSMSAHTAFSRSDQMLNPYAFDLVTGKKQPMTVITRPGCWINMIPANGLVLIPEASSGCTCGHPYSIQASLALRPVAKPLPKALIIGDSISLGYTPHVRRILEGRADVQHSPGNSQHTGTGLERLDAWLGETNWDVIHFNWGLWDLCYRHPDSKEQGNRDKVNGKVTFEPEEYEKNLRELVARLKKTGAKLIWATTTPVPEKEAGRILGDDIKYNAIAARIMKENNIVTNNLHSQALKRLPEIMNKPGDVHYTKKGYAYLAEKVAAEIMKSTESK